MSFHKAHQKIEADSDDSPVSQSPPENAHRRKQTNKKLMRVTDILHLHATFTKGFNKQ